VYKSQPSGHGFERFFFFQAVPAMRAENSANFNVRSAAGAFFPGLILASQPIPASMTENGIRLNRGSTGRTALL
jgi:hypothetical protein